MTQKKDTAKKNSAKARKAAKELPDFPERELTDNELEKLSDFVLNFCLQMTGMDLHPYQKELAWRIIFSLLSEDAEEITALFSRQSGKTEAIAVVVDGCMVMFPILAKLLPHDTRIAKFAKGLHCGIYAPTYEQAGIMWSRMKQRMYSPEAKEALLDPDIDIDLTSERENMTLPNGSFCDCGTASPQASIEGKTYHLILLEECLGPNAVIDTPGGPRTIKEVVESGYRGYVRAWDHGQETEVWARVEGLLQRPAVHDCYELTFDDGTVHQSTLEHPWFIDGVGYVRTETLFDTIAESLHLPCVLPKEETRIASGSDVIGLPSRGRIAELPRERQPNPALRSESLFQAAGVRDPEIGTPVSVWMQGREASGEPGQGVYVGQGCIRLSDGTRALLRSPVSRQEETPQPPLPGSHRARGAGLVVDGRRASKQGGESGDALYQRIHQSRGATDSEVVQGNVEYLPGVRNRKTIGDSAVTFSSSGSVIAIRDHQGLCVSRDGLQVGRFEARGMRHLRGRGDAKETGDQVPVLFLSVSEGSCSPNKLVGIKKIPALKTVYDLKTSRANFFASGVLSHNTQDINDDKIRSSIHPMGASTAGTIVKIGTCNRKRSDFYLATRRNKRNDVAKGLLRSKKRLHFEFDYTIAQRYNKRYRKYVAKERARLGEDSDDFLMKYRLHWLLDRGMFVDQDLLSECGIKVSKESLFVQKGSRKRPRRIEFKRPPNVVTYDVTTVDQVFAVDVGRENSTVVTVGKVFWDGGVEYGDDIRYPIHIEDWLEIQGDDHEAQYPQIIDFLKNYRVSQGIVDATGKGDPVYSRLAAGLHTYGITVHPFIFSEQTKDIGYKALLQELKSRRLTYPAGAKASRLLKFQMFIQQMTDLEKEWRGSKMVVHKPKQDTNSRDDFPDSLMMLNYLVNMKGSMEVETGPNPFIGKMAKWASAEMMKQAGGWFRGVSNPIGSVKQTRPGKRGRWD